MGEPLFAVAPSDAELRNWALGHAMQLRNHAGGLPGLEETDAVLRAAQAFYQHLKGEVFRA